MPPKASRGQAPLNSSREGPSATGRGMRRATVEPEPELPELNQPYQPYGAYGAPESSPAPIQALSPPSSEPRGAEERLAAMEARLTYMELSLDHRFVEQFGHLTRLLMERLSAPGQLAHRSNPGPDYKAENQLLAEQSEPQPY